MAKRLKFQLESEYFDGGMLSEARNVANARQGVVYTWKAEGGANWLQRGEDENGAIGYLVLPRFLSDGLVFQE